MSPAVLSIVDEVETAISAGSPEKRLETIKRVTDLFLLSAGNFNSEQIDLFDGVLDRLIKTIELRAIADVSTRIALAEMSSQLAPLAQAPPSVVRRLAGNDEIAIAGPVLAESARLNAEDLIEIANTKGEQHLLAISGRWWLKEIVTDVILARRYPAVSRRIINNPGARVSAAGFAIVLTQAESDPELAVETGIRVDLPRELRQKLLLSATEAVRSSLLSRAPADLFEEIRTAIAAASAGLDREMSKVRDFTAAKSFVALLHEKGELNEATLLEFASQRQYEETVAALAKLSRTTIEVVRPLMQSLRDDGILVPCKAAELGWETVRAVLDSRFAAGKMGPHELAKAQDQFAKLTVENARRLLRFWQVRSAS
ncbi:DUF2336 domain-containing protein [Bradyrhizobium sp. dw_411]|uniref:DUF2336 domain-containing protein n=1 Tax=Bradyrhizobium sp. dw_411 TaxID=2720082 RepID=UPI001BCF4C00|nr:DUF2336 domain-containing protein [Bradyrhizobium sp. dw_411]